MNAARAKVLADNTTVDEKHELFLLSQNLDTDDGVEAFFIRFDEIVKAINVRRGFIFEDDEVDNDQGDDTMLMLDGECLCGIYGRHRYCTRCGGILEIG